MIPHGVEVFVGLEPIDLRWSFDRLSGIVAERIVDSRAHGTCHARNVLVAGCGQRVEQHASIGLLRVHAIHRDDVEINIQIQRRTESLHDSQAAGL